MGWPAVYDWPHMLLLVTLGCRAGSPLMGRYVFWRDGVFVEKQMAVVIDAGAVFQSNMTGGDGAGDGGGDMHSSLVQTHTLVLHAETEQQPLTSVAEHRRMPRAAHSRAAS